MNQRLLRTGLPTAISLATGLAVWEFLARGMHATVMATPSQVARRLAEMTWSLELPRLLAESSLQFFAGYALSIVVALPLGLLMGRSRRVDRFLDPIVNALYSIPTVALVPLIVVWCGLFLPARIALVFCMTVLDMLVVVAAGARDIDRRFVDVGRSLGTSRIQQVRHILLPACLPFVFMALRVGAVRALNGMITAELFFAAVNLGAAMKRSAGDFDSAGVLAVLVTLCIAGLGVQELLRWLESRALPWYTRSEHG